ncbi:leucyl aminopeptidase [bacterium]|nr:leucyl aminopeptidase [bacterium]
MNYQFLTSDAAKQKTDLLVVLLHDTKIGSHPLANALNKKLHFDKLLTTEKFEATPLAAKLIPTHGLANAGYVLLVGLGDSKKADLETLRRVGARVYQVGMQVRAKTIITQLMPSPLEKVSATDACQALVEGVELAGYSFNRYFKPKKDVHVIKSLSIAVPAKAKAADLKKAASKAVILSEGTKLARDLVNTPANDMTPLALAAVAKKAKGVRVKVFNKAQIRRLGMELFLSVNYGSSNPPAFIEMHYKPKGKAKKRVCIIGKGITFDSGGLSIKPAKGMETMKDDMAGAAGVIGYMSVIARLNPKVEVYGFVAATDNLVDAHSTKPGDVIKSMNGKTVEILNTDAEGRLTLADALCYAGKKKPDYMVNTATLTGACLVALGDRYSAVLSNDSELTKKLIDSGAYTCEKMWELPLADEYKAELKSPIADLKNIGSGYAGTINGGLFLQEFVDKIKWAHIDIAGPAWTEKPKEYETRGGTGVMVRTWAKFVESL